MFGGVNLLSSSTRFAGPHAPAPMEGAARGRLRYAPEFYTSVYKTFLVVAARPNPEADGRLRD